MKDDISNIHEPDSFDEIFRQKFENHALPVDDKVWEEIEAKMKTKIKRIIPFWFWFSGGAAVAVLALLFTIRSFNERESYLSENKNIRQHEVVHPAKNKVDAIPESKETIQFEKKNTKHLIAKSKNLTIVAETNSSDIATFKIDSLTSEKAIVDSTLHHSVDEKSYVDQNKKVDTTSAKTNQEIYPVWENNLVKNKTKQTKNNENGILLAAAFSAGGSLPASSNGNEMADLNKNSIVTVATNYTTVMAPIDFSQITYLTPVSFGFVIQKPIDKRLKLESGLVYTYLSTNFRNGGMQQSTADLHLHYIGVPLNLIALIMDNSKWEFYLSGGGMLEKGIRSIYIQNQNFGNQTITTTASTNIAGFQWSINGAIGTTYKFQKHMGIYFEPKISYFFNDNQPISGRTDQPVSVGLTAGLRYQF